MADIIGLSLIMSDGPIQGFWIDHGQGDVHGYASPSDKVVVIGVNPIRTGLKFSYPALVVKADGIYLQTKDEKDQPKHTLLSPSLVADKLHAFLTDLEKSV